LIETVNKPARLMRGRRREIVSGLALGRRIHFSWKAEKAPWSAPPPAAAAAAWVEMDIKMEEGKNR
jgi:hypothetical protein